MKLNYTINKEKHSVILCKQNNISILSKSISSIHSDRNILFIYDRKINTNIVNEIINYDKKSLSNIGNERRPGIVHRIDKNTSGLVVVAKNNQAHENLSVQFSKHSITRVYQLLIWGKIRPSKGKIETLINRSSKNRQMMEVSNSKGKKAITN